MKKIITIVTLTGVLILGLVWWSTDRQPDNGKAPGSEQSVQNENRNSVQLEYVTVQSENKTISIPIGGRLKAENRLEIFPEVQGKVLGSEKPFREGVEFLQDEPLIRLDSDEARLQLYASRSSFQSLVASLLPDIRLDYPETLAEFEEWFNGLNPEQSLPPVPETDNRQLNRFLSTRGFFETYYRIKGAEERLKKFIIRAPFPGIVSAANAEPGQSVGPQNHLGTLVNPNQFLLTASVHQDDAQYISKGAEINLSNQEETEEWTAIVSRINPSVDAKTQMVEIYLQISGSGGLREGMYLQGDYSNGRERELVLIPKSALLRTGHVYAIRDGSIREVAVEVADVEKERVWVSGLADGDKIVRNANRALSGLTVK